MLKDTKNALLVKDDVGHSKRSTRDLPPDNFAYGKPADPDPEGVAESNLILYKFIKSYKKLEIP